MHKPNKAALIHQYLQENNLQRCIEILESATQEDHHDLPFLTRGNDVHRKLKDHKQALIYAEALLQEHPNKPVGYIRTSQDYLALGSNIEAKKAIENGLDQFPEHAGILVVAIEVFRTVKDFNNSLRYAQTLCAKHPEKPSGFIGCAEAQLNLNQADLALQTIEKGIERHPSNTHLLRMGINTANELEQKDIALKLAKLLIDSEPDNPFGYKMAFRNLIANGCIEESLELLENLKRRRCNDTTYLNTAASLYRQIGSREKALESSFQVFEIESQSKEAAVNLASDLIATQKIEKGLSTAMKENLVSEEAAKEVYEALSFTNNDQNYTNSLRESLGKLNIFPHFRNENFNPAQLEEISKESQAILCIVHVGKCAGESIILTMTRLFKSSNVRVVEYHIFGSNRILEEEISKSSSRENIHWIFLTRDPINRWISAFNWDIHTYHMNQYFYCHPEINKLFSQYSNCVELARGIANNEEEAIFLSRFHHLAFGHMAMGQAWYIPKTIMNLVDPDKTSIIRTENIDEDMHKCLEKLKIQFSFLKTPKIIKIAHINQGYQNRYKPNTFKKRHQLDSHLINILKLHLAKDFESHRLMNQTMKLK